jgi:hypothetical protein
VLQVIINIILALTAIYAAAVSTINLLQMRRQMQRRLVVSMKQGKMQLPRIPDDLGGRSAASVHVFIIGVCGATEQKSGLSSELASREG